MRIFVLATVMLLLVRAGFADSGPMEIVPGGSVRPVNNDSVSLRNEVVTITPGGDGYAVEVVYTFSNEGDAQTVTMGFPNAKADFDTKPIEKFKAFSDGKTLVISRKNAAALSPRGDTDVPDYPFFECFDVAFAKGETKTIRNTYTQDYVDGYRGHMVEYVLSTGSLWKGGIDSITIEFLFTAADRAQWRPRICFTSAKDIEQGGYFTEGFMLFPEKYRLLDDKIEMNFKDCEPYFNVWLCFPESVIRRHATSSERPSQDHAFASGKALDGDKATCWSEGKKGNGIGEYLTVVVGPRQHSAPPGAYLIEKIGIINGWAKDGATFTENNRVKKIAVSRFYLLDAGNYQSPVTTEVFELADTPDLQFITFTQPVIAGTLTFKILEVYQSTKNQDTCLSEVVIYPYDPTAQEEARLSSRAAAIVSTAGVSP